MSGKENKYNSLVKHWIIKFTIETKRISGSRKRNFNFSDAIDSSEYTRSKFDNLLIEYLNFIEQRPLMKNDYYKYVNAYKKGKELNIKYFRHSTEKLKGYYKKVDADEKYNPFIESSYNDYVLFMMLKLNGFYESKYDEIFKVKTTDHRIYSPLSKIPSVLRGELPFRVKEYDIVRCYPTFIDIELKINNRKKDVYSLIDKVKFNTLINMHHKAKNVSITDVRTQLKPIYGNKVSQVMTSKRFNNQGQMFKDLVIYEEKAIQDFIKKNEIENFVRLHDGVFVLENVKAEFLEFDKVKFAVKECLNPKIFEVRKTFYSYCSDGLLTTPKQYSDFFIQEKFIRGCEENNDKLIIFQDTNNVVKPFNHKTETVTYLKSEINELNTNEIENRIARESLGAIQQGYLLLPSKAINYYVDTSTTFGLSFKNGFIKYDSEQKLPSFETLDYSSVNGFFSPHRTQSHTFQTTDTESEFEMFLKMVSTGKNPNTENLNENDLEVFNNFCAMFGYLCHTYKNRSFNPAIILSDFGANDTSRNGGRGKSILANALQQVQTSILKGGNEFNPSYTHNFADLKSDKYIYIIDDVPANFKYDDLYTNIVGAISCQRKGTEAIEIPFEQTPKFLITTNWSVRYNDEDTSTNRRFLEYKFTDFFNITNKPIDVFGHNLFDDWNSLEWNKFYHFVFTCVSGYLANGLNRVSYNKTEDNYRAFFNNDALLNEFERIFYLLPNTFNVSNFYIMYNAFDNPLRFEKLFHLKNIKKFTEIYIKHHNLPFSYSQRTREWIKQDLNNDIDF